MQKKCKNGHYYDDSLGKCPYCMDSISVDIPDIISTPIKQESRAKEKTVIADDIPSISKEHQKEESKMQNSTDKESKTVLYMSSNNKSSSNQSEENESSTVDDGAINLAGWLVVISDKNRGRSYNITFGFNTLGRGPNNNIVLDFDQSISREKHASIIYDYANNKFFIKHEDGKYLTYLNGDVILETKELKPYDVITIGATKLLFVPLCGENFTWDI